MKGWGAYILTISCLTGLICGGIWLYQPLLIPFGHALAFPIPAVFALPTNSQVATLDLWEPKKDVLNTVDTKAPQVTAASALSYDLGANTYLFAKDTNKRFPMASLTKIMTAIVALEHSKEDDKYIVHRASLVGENVMGVGTGEVLSLRELLYGLVLPSGNDAAEVLADNFPGGRAKFIAAMNQKAESLGLSDTHFTNPSGLEGDGDQYTTAYDLLVITRYALSHFPLFKEVVGTVDMDLPATTTHKEFILSNETNLLTSYPGVKGVKDGYTPEAGLCLVTYLDYGGHTILAVILGSDDRRGEMKEILDYSLTKEGIKPPPHG